MWVLTPKGDLINLDWFHTLRVDEAAGGKQVIRAYTVHGGSEKPIATYEAEMNVIIYAEEGRVDVQLEPDAIRIEVRDRGQGIADVERALEPGFSTAPDWVRELGFGAGMGLPNIRNCSEEFEIASMVGQGTTLKITIPTEGA